MPDVPTIEFLPELPQGRIRFVTPTPVVPVVPPEPVGPSMMGTPGTVTRSWVARQIDDLDCEHNHVVASTLTTYAPEDGYETEEDDENQPEIPVWTKDRGWKMEEMAKEDFELFELQKPVKRDYIAAQQAKDPYCAAMIQHLGDFGLVGNIDLKGRELGVPKSCRVLRDSRAPVSFLRSSPPSSIRPSSHSADGSGDHARGSHADPTRGIWRPSRVAPRDCSCPGTVLLVGYDYGHQEVLRTVHEVCDV